MNVLFLLFLIQPPNMTNMEPMKLWNQDNTLQEVETIVPEGLLTLIFVSGKKIFLLKSHSGRFENQALIDVVLQNIMELLLKRIYINAYSTRIV